jgi:hypothetical protein
MLRGEDGRGVEDESSVLQTSVLSVRGPESSANSDPGETIASDSLLTSTSGREVVGIPIRNIHYHRQVGGGANDMPQNMNRTCWSHGGQGGIRYGRQAHATPELEGDAYPHLYLCFLFLLVA